MENLPQTPADWLIFGACIAGVFLLSIVLVLVHEAGHLAAGLLVGLRFVNVRVACFNLNHEDQWKVRLIRRSPLSGAVQMRAATWNPTRPLLRYCLFIAGGPCANLLFALASIWFGLKEGAWAEPIAGMGCVLSCLMFVINLVPRRGKRLDSDGRKLLDLLFSPQRRAVLLARLTFHERFGEFRRSFAAGQLEEAARQLAVLDLAASATGSAALLASLAHLRQHLASREPLASCLWTPDRTPLQSLAARSEAPVGFVS